MIKRIDCPSCNGTGLVIDFRYDQGDSYSQNYDWSDFTSRTCDGCLGEGYRIIEKKLQNDNKD